MFSKFSITALTLIAVITPASATDTSDRYALKAGDVLVVTAHQNHGFKKIRSESEPIQVGENSLAVVMQNGSANIVEVGVIPVSGMQLNQLSDRTKQKHDDSVTLRFNLARQDSSDVYVFGCVNKPGTLALSEDTPLQDVVRFSGGCNKDGNTSDIRVLRPATNETFRLKLSDGLHSDNSFVIHRGDVIEVPSLAETRYTNLGCSMRRRTIR